MTREEEDKLLAIADEKSALVDAGRWTKADFERLSAMAHAIAGDEPEACDFLLYDCDPAWFRPASGKAAE